MKFGVREICDVVLKAKANQKVGNKIFYKNEPVIYFDTLKTSSLEGAATTVYAQGGRGNSRLIAWEGERTVTFTMEDALISPAGFMILSGAGLIEAGGTEKIFVHATETTNKFSLNEDKTELTVYLEEKPAQYDENNKGTNKLSDKEDYIYIMALDSNGEVASEPFIPYDIAKTPEAATLEGNKVNPYAGLYAVKVKSTEHAELNGRPAGVGNGYTGTNVAETTVNDKTVPSAFDGIDAVLVDYYVEKDGHAQQIEITPDKFGGNYYLEASTLFRDQSGVDMPAEFIIPNCKIQSNFTFTMASSGDPSTFTFTMDAFPDYTRFDKTKKVLAAIQIITESQAEDVYRKATNHTTDHDLVID